MGNVVYSNIQDGDNVNAADVNAPMNALHNEFNGNIDGTNIKDNAINGSKLADNAVTATKIADGAVTDAKLGVKYVVLDSAATITPSKPITIVPSLATAAAIAAPSFSAYHGQSMILRIKDNGVARALDFTTATVYRAVGVTIPTTTTVNKTLYVGAVYNLTDNKWDVIAVAREA